MSIQDIKVQLVNVCRYNTQIHAILEMSTDTDILLIQEPWFGTVMTQRLDTDPDGIQQLGPPIHGKWDVHIPKHEAGTKCKVVVYMKKRLTPLIETNLRLLYANHSTLILDLRDDAVLLRIVNIYHDAPKTGHNLQHLFQAQLDELTPTL